MPLYCRYFIILLAVFLVFTGKAWSQASVSGPSCVLPGNYYGPYTINGISWSSADKWCVTGGTINSTGNSCINNNGAPSIGITWNTGITTGTVAYYSPANNPTPVATLTVSVINPGSISPGVSYVPAGQQVTLTLNGSGASGCSGTYSYQWLVSSNNGSTWNNLSGANGLSYTVTATYTSNFQYRIAVTNSNLAGIAYTNPAVVVAIPPITTGTVSPSSASVNFNTSPGTLTATASSGGVCGGNYSYQWQSSVNNSTWTNISGATGLSFSPGNLTTTTYFRQAVTCGPLTQYTNTATVTVYPPLNVGTATPSQNVLINSATAPLSLSGVSGGNGTYTYQWQQSPDNITWNNIGGATNATYSPGSLASAGTTYYRAIVTSNGVNAISAAATITALLPLSAGTITGPAGPVTYNTSPGLSSSQNATNGNCNGSYTYQWQQSGDNNTWSNIDGATGSSYSPANLVLPNYYFRRQVSCGTETAWSNTLTITVTPQLLTGTITPDNLAIAAGTSPGELTANPASGGGCSNYNYQWQQSTDGSTWNSISGATGQNYTPGALNSTTWFRRQVSCGTSVTYTNVSTVTVGSSAICDWNYIRERDFFRAGITDKAVADAINDLRSVKQSTQYFDGLGRPVQKVIKQASSGLNDMVSLNIYDGFGRETNKYLPYVANAADGGYRCTALSEQKTFYTALFPDEKYYYGQVDYEPSPVGRVAKTYAPGTNWIGSSRGISTQYLTNTGVDQVRIWMVADNTDELGSYSTAQGSAGIYPAGSLFKTITVDEKNNQVIEFKDKEGKVVLKKVQLTASADAGIGSGYAGWLCTYYIYDDLNNLRCVVQPHGVELLTQNMWDMTALNGVILDEQCFRYAYDQRQRMIIKKVPGANKVYMVYDARDRLVMMQDANLRSANTWIVTLYENNLNRPVQTGKLLNTWNNKTFTQHLTDAAVSSAYPFDASSTPSTTYWEYLTKTGYDDYNSMPAASSLNSTFYNDNSYNSNFFSTYNASPDYAQPLTASTQTTGLVTWTETKVLNTSTYLYTVNIYDDKNRLIQVKSTNVTGGADVSTTQYSWGGQPLITVQQQVNNNISQTNTIVTKMSYDDLGRLVKTEKKVGNSSVNGGALPAAYTTIAQNEYDALGQLKKKRIGNKPGAASGTALFNLDYEYNIRGWLLSVNKDYISNNTNSDQYFAMQLGYDKDGYTSFPNKQYNGNISGMIWKSEGDQQKRKYDFTYDAVNRLTGADFNQSTGGSTFDKSALMDFSVSNLSYDANGNIVTMWQQGWKVGGSTYIDKLTYNYITNSNKLLNVIDAVNDAQTKMGDFRTSMLHPNSGNKTNGTVDYSYDANGNMVKDLNKDIISYTGGDGIAYNHLNLPQTITVKKDATSNKGTITYTYDAMGNKLKKVTAEANATVAYNGTNYTDITTTTTYLGGLVYESKSYSNPSLSALQYSDVLQFVTHEEGRIRFAKATSATCTAMPDRLIYDYFIKDHLGNTRMVLTEQNEPICYPTLSFEGAVGSPEIQNQDNTWESKTGQSINVNSVRVSNSGMGSYAMLVRKSTGAIGSAKLLKVMAGDRIHTSVDYYYTVPNANNTGASGITSLVTNFMSAMGGSAAVSGVLKDGASTITSALNNNSVLSGLLNTPNNTGGPNQAPKAYLNIIFFDDQFNFDATTSTVVPVAYSPGTMQTINKMAANAITAKKSGYVYVYFSNESDELVYFDNFMLTHEAGPIMEETHYYPFGLSMAGISSKAAGSLENKRDFHGKEMQNKEFSDGSGLELYDFGSRDQDPQIGRWWTIDPKAEKYFSSSPYNFVDNNPISRIDLTGQDWFYYQAKGEKQPGWHWVKGHKSTYTNTDGKSVTTKNGFRYIAFFSYDKGTTWNGGHRGTLVLYDQNKVLKTSSAFSGGGVIDDFKQAGAQNYYMYLGQRDMMSKENKSPDNDNHNPPPTSGMQKIEEGTTVTTPDGEKHDVNSDYGNYRIRLNPTSGRDRGLYLHGKNSFWTSRTHGCVCEKDQEVLEYLWDHKEINVKVPFAVGQEKIISEEKK